MFAVNIALDLLGAVIALIVFVSCLTEHIKKRAKSKTFLVILASTIVVLVADAISGACIGSPQLATLTIIFKTAADCVACVVIVCIMRYLQETIFLKNRATKALLYIFVVLSAISVAASIANAYYGFAFSINGSGYVVNGPHLYITRLFSVIALVSIALSCLFVRGIKLHNRLFSLTYPLFPLVGAVIDYFSDFSMMNIGYLISVILIYTNIYLQTRRAIQEQRTQIMISQINPHFMYNTLTTVASLCEISPKEAQELIVDFSTYLRRNINTLQTNQLISFEEELKHVECYLKIEKARFKDRVNVVYSIQSESFLLPALTVQPLVENAIKHGITKKVEGGTVRISTYSTDKEYVIEIKDDGVGFDVGTDGGDINDHVGISNVRDRLRSMCRGTLTVKSKRGVGTRVTVTIPKKKGAGR